jgi:hypothetical protein
MGSRTFGPLCGRDSFWHLSSEVSVPEVIKLEEEQIVALVASIYLAGQPTQTPAIAVAKARTLLKLAAEAPG